jgi:hypothetical protein
VQARGFVFFEIYVEDLAYYTRIFRDGLGFAVAEDDPDFVKLKSRRGTVLLNAMILPESHVFANVRSEPVRGMGVELGIVTDDVSSLTAARARTVALGLERCTISEIVHQEWGMSDFRLLTKEGYFFRVTTPDPDEATSSSEP